MTTKADTSVKYFSSDMSGAPTATNAIGSLIGILDACLVNGFCVRTPDSVVIADGVATVSIGAGNPYPEHSVILVSGASNPALNGEWKVATSAASSLTFLCPGITNGAISGVSLKLAPADWSVPFSETNKRVYQSKDPDSTQCFFRFDNTVNPCIHRGYTHMSNIDSGADEFPPAAQQATSIWHTSSTSTPRSWQLIADGSFFYFSVFVTGVAASSNLLYLCGDINRFIPNDKYAAITAGSYNVAISSVQAYLRTILWNTNSGAPGGPFAPRGIQGAPTAEYNLFNCAMAGSSTGSSGPSYPELSGLLTVSYPVIVRNGSSAAATWRGTLPGACAINTDLSAYNTTPPLDKISIPGAPGKVYKMIKAFAGWALIDITGPWR